MAAVDPLTAEDDVEAPASLEELFELVSDRRLDAMPWSRRAACLGEGHLFYNPPGERPETAAGREAAALYYCSICPVVGECRAYAREHREYGVWGGETELDRALAGFGVALPVGNIARVIASVGRL